MLFLGALKNYAASLFRQTTGINPNNDPFPVNYQNLSGRSGVDTFQKVGNSMNIQFKGGGPTYTYPIDPTMIRKAEMGFGLNRYLNANRGHW